MTLKEQFSNISKTSILIKTHSERCEKLSDNFAIGFLLWVDKNFYQGNSYDSFRKTMESDTENFNVLTLLETYKKEMK